MEYAFLAIAIVSEVIATSYLKQTEGFTKLTPSLICAAAYIVCHYTFAKSLNRINLNIGYATWCGVGLIVTSLVSIFAYKEKTLHGWNHRSCADYRRLRNGERLWKQVIAALCVFAVPAGATPMNGCEVAYV